jgi:hypothetical protein
MAGRAPPNAYELARRWNSPPRRRKTKRKSK